MVGQHGAPSLNRKTVRMQGSGGSSAILVLALLVSGYLIATFCYRFKFLTARQAGHRLYLTSAALGILVVFLVEVVFSLWNQLAAYTSTLICTPALSKAMIEPSNRGLLISVFSPIVAILLILVYNSLRGKKHKNLQRAWERDDFSALVAYATREILPIAVTLESGKVYVGLIARSTEPDHESAHLTLLPLYSGYRCKDTQSMKLTNSYDGVFELIEKVTATSEIRDNLLKNYYLVVPLSKITTANVFNYELYNTINGALPAES